ncbi:hypothetical protein [Ruixingdingia sedimenti]|uniref:Uncharacterized protein n=1 Tax=Ruixingdingia sedimenti TaxID=3073604 RepID=A0ABU1FEG0_9RHOB|nr:hypothetical protein [Xinfangfangia sp. LG-4]MDR5655294.1 hypothetical protein [Xinfangfangia sp. LG-4]
MRPPTAHEQLTSAARFGRAGTVDLWRGRADPDPVVRWLALIELARRHPIYRCW